MTRLESDAGPLVWSPDGSKIAFKRVFRPDGGPGAIYTIPKQGGEESRLIELFNANFSSSIDWSPDGTQVVFSDSLPATGQLALYSFNVHTREKRKLTSPPPGDWGDWDPKFSPDGNTLAFKRVRGFWSDTIYLMSAVGGQIRQLTGGSVGVWGHAWQPAGDGVIVSTQRGFDGSRCGEPSPFTVDSGAETSDYLPSWSADGSYVYFASTRSGRDQVWKQALAGGEAIQVTRNGGYSSYESPDGKWLYFSNLQPLGIWRIPGSRPEPGVSSEERLLIGPPVDVAPTGWTLTPDEILFVGVAKNGSDRVIRGYNLASGKMRTVLTLHQISERGTNLSVSPDFRWLLYAQLDRSGSNIVVAEAGY